VAFDEGYGNDPAFWSGLDERYIGEVPKSCCGWLQGPKVQRPRLDSPFPCTLAIRK